jgi:sigma-B regulation protein RsbU (phosphoserine phosphatase)
VLRVPPLRTAVRLPQDRLELAARGVPAQAGPGLLGDAWHWLRLPSGELHLALVDAEGCGPRAHQQAQGLLALLRQPDSLTDPPGIAISQLAHRHTRARGLPGLATVLVARLDPLSGHLALAAAGHLPPLLVPVGSPARFIPVPGVTLGCPGGGPLREVRLRLAPGDLLILYTDGLVEHASDLPAGLRDLKRRAGLFAGWTLGLEVVVEALAAPLFGPTAHRDDGLVIALRIDPLSSAVQPPLRTRSLGLPPAGVLE